MIQTVDRHNTGAMTLSLQLLGPFQLSLNNEQLNDIGSRKARALLAYLAVVGKPVPRSSLMTIFWSEKSERAAKNNLRSTLTILRKHLKPYIRTSTATVAFNYDLAHEIDVAMLHEHIDRAMASQDPIALLRATDLYTGKFLSEFTSVGGELFETWVLQQRGQIHSLIVHALEETMAISMARGQYAVGIDAGRKLLTLEPWSERAHRQLMLLLSVNGQYEEANEQYQACYNILAKELGVKPTAETETLYRRIQADMAQSIIDHQHPATISSQPLEPTDHRTGLSGERENDRSPATDTAQGLVVPNNLWTPLTTFIGRHAELANLVAQLTREDCQLISILGLGGIGKSALALAVGHRLLREKTPPFPDGIFFVSLAGIQPNAQGDHRAPAGQEVINTLMIQAIAQAIGYQAQKDNPLQDQLFAHLRSQRLLLILDRFEHLHLYVEQVTTLLAHAPLVTVLITSRIKLLLPNATTVLLDGLSLSSHTTFVSIHQPRYHCPPDLSPGISTVTHSLEDRSKMMQMADAVALFVERAQQVDPNFTPDSETLAMVQEICQAVHGLPLAIEMISSWIPHYSYTEIATWMADETERTDRLTSQFQDQSTRHHRLQQVFEDSWQYLSTHLQEALAKLAIFDGCFTASAAEAVGGITMSDLMQLCDHSLLQIDEDHYFKLYPLIRAFCRQKWLTITAHQPEARLQLQQAHSGYYLGYLANLAHRKSGVDEFTAIHELFLFHTEVVNSWRWALEQNQRQLIRASMAGLYRYLELSTQNGEGKFLFGMAGDLPHLHTALDSENSFVLWLQVAHCHFLRRLAEYGEARRRIDHILAHTSTMPIDHQTAKSTGNQEETLVREIHTFALCESGWIHYEQGNYDSAKDDFAQAHVYAYQKGNVIHLIEVHNGLGAVAFSQKKYGLAHAYYETALVHARRQSDFHHAAIILGNLAANAQIIRNYKEAGQYLQMRLQIDKLTQNERQTAISYQRLGQLALVDQEYTNAESFLRKSVAYFEEHDSTPELIHVLLDLCRSLLRQQRVAEAEKQCLRSLELAIQAQMTPRILAALTILAEIRIAEEKKEDALMLLQVVYQNTQIPAATWRHARKLQETLAAEFDEKALTLVRQKLMKQSLQEFGTSLLM